MTNEEVLLKAWNVATDRGWEFDNLDKWQVEVEKVKDTVMTNWYRYVFTLRGDYRREIDAERIIFDHDFAKALLGEPKLNRIELMVDDNAPPYTLNMMTQAPQSARHYWEYHLQQMVIAEDPIKYLGENIGMGNYTVDL